MLRMLQLLPVSRCLALMDGMGREDSEEDQLLCGAAGRSALGLLDRTVGLLNRAVGPSYGAAGTQRDPVKADSHWTARPHSL